MHCLSTPVTLCAEDAATASGARQSLHPGFRPICFPIPVGATASLSLPVAGLPPRWKRRGRGCGDAPLAGFKQSVNPRRAYSGDSKPASTVLAVFALPLGVSLRPGVRVARGSGRVLGSSQRASRACQRHARSRQSLGRQRPWRTRLDSAQEPAPIRTALQNGFRPRLELTGLQSRARC